MATLRNLRSITHLWESKGSEQQKQPAHATKSDTADQGTVKRHRLRKFPQPLRSSSNLLDASVDKEGTFTLHHHHSENPLAELGRRLAHKASTFSLRSKRRQGQRDQQEAAEEEERLKELVLIGSDKGTVKKQVRAEVQSAETRGREDNITTPRQALSNNERLFTRNSSLTTVRACEPVETTPSKELPPLPAASDPGASAISVQDVIRKNQETFVTQAVAGGLTAVKKMASEQAQPPIPYTRLKEITELACEMALSGVTTYTHTDTEKWNTTIINSILGALVQETTHKPPAGSSAPAQPQFKYVVNSTIIQHAASASSASVEDVKKPNGRRGMHAASGAYWNNEKDGMWSFKYPGADSKGLDVVVGIIWVWVG